VTSIWMAGVDASESTAEERARLASVLAAAPHILLETCHRVELYGSGEPSALDGLRVRTGDAAARHLCRVAAGLESASVGEHEVLGQVRSALDRARASGREDPAVVRLFEVAIGAGRKARSYASPPSPGLAAAAVTWLDGQVALRGSRVLVVGRGTMGAALARSAERAGAQVTVATRTPVNGQRTLQEAAATAGGFAAVAVALAGPWRELTEAPPAPIADLSSPAAVASLVRDRLGDRYLGIDDLFSMRADAGRWARRAEEAVEGAVIEYQTWLASRGTGDLIETLLARTDQRRRARVDGMLRRLGDLDERQAKLIEQLSRQLVADVLHEPLAEIRRDGSGERRESARRLFQL
jgi:glutamyl-tRNA reductase